ncbi:uncharacterized protein LOC122265763 [Penaeus japonicus]|uniref:uncharacterized protein LOC122265763 n=1 Tax=Penaeus japonicus TaxID=27405 RepID=UPI001C711308|nr:uncharacterized protein LOC122265763 [Penaeus japonicus]
MPLDLSSASSDDLDWTLPGKDPQQGRGARRRSRRIVTKNKKEGTKREEEEKETEEEEKETEKEEEKVEKTRYVLATQSLFAAEKVPSARKTQGRERRSAEEARGSRHLGRSELPRQGGPFEVICVVEHTDSSGQDDTASRGRLQDSCAVRFRTHIKNYPPSGYGCVKIRALKTLPSILALGWSDVLKGDMGIWAKEDLGRNCLFGPYEGKKSPYLTQTRYCPCCNMEETTRLESTLPVDPVFPKYNWMRFVRGVGCGRSANLKPLLHQGQVFYASTRPIMRGTELVVKLEPEYSRYPKTRD